MGEKGQNGEDITAEKDSGPISYSQLEPYQVGQEDDSRRRELGSSLVRSKTLLNKLEELDVYMESEEANYQLFSDSLTSKRRAAAEQAAPPPSASIIAGQPSNTVDLAKKAAFSTPNSQMSFSNRPTVAPSNKSPAAVSRPTTAAAGSPSVKGAVGNVVNGHTAGKVDMDSFVPDDGDFDNFLDEADANKDKTNMAISNVDSSDEEGGNPMVSKYDDEVDVDNYESAVDITAARDETDDSDDDQVLATKTVKPVDFSKNDNLAEKHIVVEKQVESPGDDLEDFLNDGDDCDNSVKSLHTDYETL